MFNRHSSIHYPFFLLVPPLYNTVKWFFEAKTFLSVLSLSDFYVQLTLHNYTLIKNKHIITLLRQMCSNKMQSIVQKSSKPKAKTHYSAPKSAP